MASGKKHEKKRREERREEETGDEKRKTRAFGCLLLLVEATGKEEEEEEDKKDFTFPGFGLIQCAERDAVFHLLHEDVLFLRTLHEALFSFVVLHFFSPSEKSDRR